MPTSVTSSEKILPTRDYDLPRAQQTKIITGLRPKMRGARRSGTGPGRPAHADDRRRNRVNVGFHPARTRGNPGFTAFGPQLWGPLLDRETPSATPAPHPRPADAGYPGELLMVPARQIRRSPAIGCSYQSIFCGPAFKLVRPRSPMTKWPATSTHARWQPDELPFGMSRHTSARGSGHPGSARTGDQA